MYCLVLFCIIHAIAHEGPIHCTHLGEVTGRTPNTISYHLDRLATAGLVVQTLNGSSVRNRLSPRGRLELGVESDGTSKSEEQSVG